MVYEESGAHWRWAHARLEGDVLLAVDSEAGTHLDQVRIPGIATDVKVVVAEFLSSWFSKDVSCSVIVSNALQTFGSTWHSPKRNRGVG